MTEEDREINPYLDYLYNTNVRCPYCRSKILKYTTTCAKCGIQKTQIHSASNILAKQEMKSKTGGKIFLTSRRPLDVSFTRMILWLLPLGLFGAHCFHVGRYKRGHLILWCMIFGLVGTLFFPATSTARTYFTDMYLIGDAKMFFPTDILFLIALGIWLYDFAAVVFGYFKYPVRLGEAVKRAK